MVKIESTQTMAILIMVTMIHGYYGQLIVTYTSPGRTAETTLLAPDNYVMECYIKMPDGTYHWKKGMFKDLHVMADTTKAKAPQSPD